MSTYWTGYAPNYSREVEAAYAAVKAAEDRLRASLKASYPLGALVRVVHRRGGETFSFYGNVAGWDRCGSRVLVTNQDSGKSMKWWSAHVELIATP